MNARDLFTASGIRRIFEDRMHWHVLVETWPARDGFHGRVVFSPEGSISADKRECPAALRGHTREDVIAKAYSLPESRLKQLFRSLG